MQNKTLMMKLIAVILILMLSLSNFLVLVSYAAEISSENTFDLFSQNSETNNKNIEFNSYLKVDNNATYSAKLNLADANKIYINLKLSNSGYLKTGTINFEEESFNFIKQEENVSTIQNIDYNTKEILLNQIDGGTEVELEIPIEIAKNELFSIQNLNKNNKVIFTGTYVTEKGKEVGIEKEILLNITWDSTIEGKVEQNISKYINNINRYTLIELKLNSYLEHNIMPLKETNIEFEVPEIEGKLPKYINVVANSLLSTIGVSNGNDFGENNFEYIEDEKKVKINVQNIQNEQGQISWKDGVDEYKVILVYEALSEDEKTLALNTKVSFDVYGKTERIEKTVNSEVILRDNVGNLNEIDVSTDTQDIYKSFMYANSEYETEYSTNWNLDIGYANISDKIIISDIEDRFISVDGEKTIINNNSYYKQTIINRRNFEKILGKEGYVKILNEANEELAYITLEMTEDEDMVINYENSDLSKIKIETSKPQTEGTIKIRHVKAIKAITEYERELIKTFETLESEANLKVWNNIIKKVTENEEEEEIKEVKIVEVNNKNSINLLEPKENVKFEISEQTLFSNKTNQNIGFNINLINSEDKDALYQNPVITIKLPNTVENVEILDAKILLTDELSIEQAEFSKDNKEIRIVLKGIQTKYNIQSIIDSVIISVNTNIELNSNLEKDELVDIKLNLFNEYTGNEVELISQINLVKIEEDKEDNNEETEDEINREDKEEINGEIEDETNKEEENDDGIKDENNNKTDEEQVNDAIVDNKVKVEISCNNDNAKLYEGQIVTYTIEVTNISNDDIKEVTLRSDIPEGTIYCEYKLPTEDTDAYYKDNEEIEYKQWYIEKIAPGEIAKVQYNVRIGKTAEGNNIKANAAIYKNEAEVIVYSNDIIYTVEKGYIQTEIMIWPIEGDYVKPGRNISYDISLKKIVDNLEGNIVAKMGVPEGTTFVDAYFVEESNQEYKEIRENVEYKKESNLVIWNISDLKEVDNKEIELIIKVNEDIKTSVISNKLILELDNNVIFESYSLKQNVDLGDIDIEYNSNIPEGYISENEELVYELKIKNTSKSIVNNINISDIIPSDLYYEKMIYKTEDKEIEINSYGSNNMSYSIDYLMPGETAYIYLYTKTKTLSRGQELKEITNKIDIEINEDKLYQTNEIKHIIEGEGTSPTKEGTYRITGNIWNDSNSDGKKDSGESLINDVQVILIDSNTSNVTKDYEGNEQIVTATNGAYTFKNVENGQYYIVFLYDSSKYGITEYQRSGVGEQINSDAIGGKITVNGKEQVVGITGLINIENNNKYNIDLGLINSPKFDLELDKYISKVVTKFNNGEQEVTNYNYSKFAKTEIHSKLIEGSIVSVEYTIVVKNVGQVAGYAKDIVDYISNEYTFNPNQNPGWSIGEDGYLHYTALENAEIGVNEEKKITLVVSKKLTGEDTGIINNIAEIAESYSIQGNSDNDSIGGNKLSLEDDLSNANIMISVKTGRTIMYISLTISMMLTLGIGIYFIKTKVLNY